MKEVFIIADNIFSPLATTTAENFIQLKNNISSVKEHNDVRIADEPFYASLFNADENFIEDANQFTKFEQMLIASIQQALQNSDVDSLDEKTLLIISTTKGNISLLETNKLTENLQERIALTTSAKLVADHFKCVNQPLVISNACISGLLAIITAMRLIRFGKYENVIVAGADVISKFIFSGFQSFQALSSTMCKPFDKNRDGINLGEGAATVNSFFKQTK